MKKSFKSVIAYVVVSLVAVSGATYMRTSATSPNTTIGGVFNTGGGAPNSQVDSPSVSQDGRYVAFRSNATNLVSGVTISRMQVFVRDRLNNTNQLISVSTTGAQGNVYSQAPHISADGRYVAFASSATDLVSSGSNGNIQIYVRDLVNNTTQVASSSAGGAQGNADSETDMGISADGRYVTFTSGASNLTSSATISQESVYLKDMSNGSVKLISATGSGTQVNAQSFSPSISCEGRFVAFISMANDLNTTVSNDSSKTTKNLIVADTFNGSLKNITNSTPQGSIAGQPHISCNGSYIGFIDDANNIVSGDTNGATDAFVYDRINNSYDRVSINSSGTEANDFSQNVTASNDGRYAVYESAATNLVSGDTNSNDDIFLRDRQAGTTQLVSKNSSGTIGNAFSYQPSITSDGRYVLFGSTSTNLVSGYANTNGFVYSSQTGATNDY